MNKVGIITLFQNYNYGATLQAYALQKKVRDLEYDVETIQYTRKAFNTNSFSIYDFFIRVYNHFYRKLFRGNVEIKKNEDPSRKKMFDSFIENYICISKQKYDKSNINKSNSIYDVFICGSDNIWNINLFDSAFMLDFVSNGKKKIAYAPGMSTNSLSRKQRKLFLEPISKINCLSCREKMGARVINKYLHRKIPVVCDPTLLLTADSWRKIEVCPKQILPTKYIFSYICAQNDLVEKKVFELSAATGLPVIVIPDMTESYNLNNNNYIYMNNVGPNEFLYLIDHAEFIATDSFHGTVFANLFNKEFFSFDRFHGRNTVHLNERIHNLLKILHVAEDRIIEEKSDITKISPINWNKVNANIRKTRMDGLNYLIKSLRYS